MKRLNALKPHTLSHSLSLALGVVLLSHGSHENQEGMEEARRILHLHLKSR